MSNVAYGKRGAKAANLEAIRAGGEYARLVDVTENKTPPSVCYGKDPEGEICASISPRPKGKHCWPCAKDFQDNAKRDMSFTNYRSSSDWR